MCSGACVKACPEGDILGLIKNRPTLLHASRCVGHGQCAASCPVDAISLVFGTAKRGVDIPHVHNLTDFPLIGAHNQLGTDCASCHIGGVFAGLPAECIDCHQQDFDEVEEPSHIEQEFSQDCTECHSNDAWEPATFDHNLTDFPLTGAHSRTDCASCHIAEVFANLPSTCIDCHQKDEPTNHFGPACVECHTTSAWEPSTFDHEPLFPLTRGNHQRYRTSCTSCHLDPATYEVFTCTDCHDGEHEKRDMDDEHDDVRNYVYESTACFDCHPRGSE